MELSKMDYLRLYIKVASVKETLSKVNPCESLGCNEKHDALEHCYDILSIIKAIAPDEAKEAIDICEEMKWL